MEEVAIVWNGPYKIETVLDYFYESGDSGVYMITRKWGAGREKILYIGLTYYQDFSTRLSQHQYWISKLRGPVKVRVGYPVEKARSERRLKDIENLLICWHEPEYNETNFIYNGRDLRIINSGRKGPLDKIIDSDNLDEE